MRIWQKNKYREYNAATSTIGMPFLKSISWVRHYVVALDIIYRTTEQNRIENEELEN